MVKDCFKCCSIHALNLTGDLSVAEDKQNFISEFLWCNLIFCYFFVVIAQLMRFWQKTILQTNNLGTEFAFSRYCYNNKNNVFHSFSICTEFLNPECIFSHWKWFDLPPACLAAGHVTKSGIVQWFRLTATQAIYHGLPELSSTQVCHLNQLFLQSPSKVKLNWVKQHLDQN